MKKLLLIIFIAILPSFSFAKDIKKRAGPVSQATSQPTTNDWSFFWNAINHPLKIGFETFETGVIVYHVSQNDWSLLRTEPYIKLRWAILGKYLQFYLFMGLDITSVDYTLKGYEISGLKISLDVNIVSNGNMFFGGGAQFLLVSWKDLSIYGYLQTQMTPLNDAELNSAHMSIDASDYDLYDAIEGHIHINYKIQRYDCGAILRYNPLKWLTAYASVGYLWFSVNMNIDMDEELANTIKLITGKQPRNLIPNRLVLDEESVFASVGFKFKLYKWLNLGIEGIVVPIEDNPIYFGQGSIIIEQ